MERNLKHGTHPQQADMQPPAGDAPSDIKVHARQQTPRFLPLLPPAATSPLARTRSGSPSPSTTPTTYSFASTTGTISPRSLGSSIQTVTSASVITFPGCHSRDPSLDSSPFGRIRVQNSFSGGYRIAKRKGYQPGSTSLALPGPYRHRQMESIDWSSWRHGIPWTQGPHTLPGYEQENEPEDEDLRAYRQENQPVVREAADAGTPKPPVSHDECEAHAGNTVLWCLGIPASHEADEWPEQTLEGNLTSVQASDAQRDTYSECSIPDDVTQAGMGDDDTGINQAERVARHILSVEFGHDLGCSDPPPEMVEPVRLCLDQLSLAIQHVRRMGFLSATQSVAASHDLSGQMRLSHSWTSQDRSSSTVTGKRPAVDALQDAEEDDLGENDPVRDDGRIPSGPSETGNRKRAKLEQYPCPFRKRNPLLFNCREWEFCYKAPFNTMPELKRHLRTHHQQAPTTHFCLRCHMQFSRLDDLQSHLRLPSDQICASRDGDAPRPEEMSMNTAVRTRLQSRARADQLDWPALWHALFPNNRYIPQPVFEPVVELHEVAEEYRSSFSEFAVRLSSTVETHLCSRGGPGRDMVVPLSGALENLLREYITTVFKTSQTRVNNDPRAVPKRSSQPPTEAASPAPASRTRAPSLASPVPTPVPRLLAPNPMQRRHAHSFSRTASATVSPNMSVRTSSASLAPSHRSSFVGSVSSRSSIQASLPSRPTASPVSAPSPSSSHHAPVSADPAVLGVQNDKGPQVVHSRDSGIADVGGFGGDIFEQQSSQWKSTSGCSNLMDCYGDRLSGGDGAVEAGDMHFEDAVMHDHLHRWTLDAEESLGKTLETAVAMDPALLGSGEGPV